MCKIGYSPSHRNVCYSPRKKLICNVQQAGYLETIVAKSQNTCILHQLCCDRVFRSTPAATMGKAGINLNHYLERSVVPWSC